ncbi:unnamed protein product [Rodentolepis nana]|uniref:PKD_channel domain-containing protein n=1 Tax=Rodentolepis nana TaxID=102285 RepID=A0A158QI40_RODNA|nr:unnamed protein product [Rodentolepis nana]
MLLPGVEPEPTAWLEAMPTVTSRKHLQAIGIITKLPYELIQHQQTISYEHLSTGHHFQSIVEGTEASELYFFSNGTKFRKYELTWNSNSKDHEVEGWFDTWYSSLEFPMELAMAYPKFKRCKATGNFIALDSGKIVLFRDFEHNLPTVFDTYMHIFSNWTNFKFVTEAVSPDIPPKIGTQSTQIACLIHNSSIIYRLVRSLRQVLTYNCLNCMPYVKLTENTLVGQFGAMASTSLYDRVDALSAYVSVNEDFSLLNLSAPSREIEQINFRTRKYTCGNSISYMQCILDVSKNRRGIVVQRCNGGVELWDDRQPKCPSVIYIPDVPCYDISLVPHPPVVEWPMQSMIALSPARCRSILLCRLETGEPINVLEYPGGFNNESYQKIIFRSEWNFDRCSPCPPGPLFWFRPSFSRLTVPILPVRFYADFTITYTPRDDPDMPIPPWFDGIPPDLPYSIGRGYAVYASDLDMMVENYTDYCVPIFLPNADFPCVMLNYNHTAYLISPTLNGYGPCCVYRPNWSPPHRDFMRNFEEYYHGSTNVLGEKRKVLNQTIDWWDIPLLESGKPGDHPLFGGFGFARKPLPSTYRPYVSFWYEGDVGWAQQIFENFTDTGPGIHLLDNFQLPNICKTNLACNFKP